MLRRKPTSESGVVIAEAAMILPVFILVSFILIDIQWMTRNASAIEYIVTESARCEAIQGSACTAPYSAATYAQRLAGDLHIPLQPSQLQAPPCNGSVCQVTIAYQYKQLGAWFPPFTITRTGTAAQAPILP